jgi:hypothetical protein
MSARGDYGGPAWPDHKLGGIYALMDRHGMLPDDWSCMRCAKQLGTRNPAELYAGTWNGLCYGCTSEGPYVAAVAALDGARKVSWPPNCPSYRRDRQEHYAYEDCENCKGLGATGYHSTSHAAETCKPCLARYCAHPVRRAAEKWLTLSMTSCQAAFEAAWDQAAGVPKRCSNKRRLELRALYAGPDRDHATPEYAALKEPYQLGYQRIRALIGEHFAARGYNQWTSTFDEEAWVRAYCKWRGLDYEAMKAEAEEANAP